MLENNLLPFKHREKRDWLVFSAELRHRLRFISICVASFIELSVKGRMRYECCREVFINKPTNQPRTDFLILFTMCEACPAYINFIKKCFSWLVLNANCQYCQYNTSLNLISRVNRKKRGEMIKQLITIRYI